VKYSRPALRSALSAQYALGTLQGRARRRFEQLVAADPAMRAELRKWEQRFAQLALRLKPMPPRPIVWTGLMHRLSSSTVTPLRPAAPPTGWRTLALLATAASVVLAIALSRQVGKPAPQPQVVVQQVPVPSAPIYVATLQPEKRPTSWLVTVTPGQGRMKVKVLDQYPTTTQQDLELWVIAGGKPVSVGVMPKSGAGEMAWPKNVPFAEKLVLAVSLEPSGGSPTGSPTGPVLATGEILQPG
jgi:anti-sigma-K factor RskA